MDRYLSLVLIFLIVNLSHFFVDQLNHTHVTVNTEDTLSEYHILDNISPPDYDDKSKIVFPTALAFVLFSILIMNNSYWQHRKRRLFTFLIPIFYQSNYVIRTPLNEAIKI